MRCDSLQYGLPDRLEELDGEGRETLQEAFKADPSWSKKVWQLSDMSLLLAAMSTANGHYWPTKTVSPSGLLRHL